jgi:ATP-dependent Clp protease ATP-binding subunit ClpA
MPEPVRLAFEAKSVNRDAVYTAVERIFSPEFRNRLDGVVNFNSLTHEVVLLIVKKAINEFSVQLQEKNVSLQVTDQCYEWLARKGYSEEFGAREIARLIQDKLKRFFVDEVLFGKLHGGGTALADIKDDDVAMQVSEE